MDCTTSDADLWAAVRAHSGEAFAELYRVHADRVYTHLFQRIRCRADAEDLTSEVFVTAWQRRDAVRLHPEAGILPWLLVCANYLLKSRRRSIARAQRLLATISVLAEPDVALSVVEDAEDEWNLRLLSQILAELRPADQDIIQLCVVQGFSTQTVADTSGEAVGTVRSRLSRALARLRELHSQATLSDSIERTQGEVR